jgi:hypothetical protein
LSTVRIEGLPHLYKQLQKLKGQLGSSKVEPVMEEAADTLTAAVKDRAPFKTGVLMENIVTLKLPPLGDNPASYMTKVKQRTCPLGGDGSQKRSAPSFFSTCL